MKVKVDLCAVANASCWPSRRRLPPRCTGTEDVIRELSHDAVLCRGGKRAAGWMVGTSKHGPSREHRHLEITEAGYCCRNRRPSKEKKNE